MLTNEQILLYLYNDEWFIPSKSTNKYKITLKDGQEIEVPKSYYHKFNNIGQIIIRVSEHGTYLNTWVKHKDDPTISLQNLSVVFANTPVEYSKKVEPRIVKKEDGTITTAYTYFVVEQYVYRLDNLNEQDFNTVINQIKSLSNSKVFKDPLKKKPSKVASRTVLTPNDLDNNPIPSSANSVNPRQTVVVNNKDYEVDALGNILKNESFHYRLNRIIIETLNRVIRESILKENLKKEPLPLMTRAEINKRF